MYKTKKHTFAFIAAVIIMCAICAVLLCGCGSARSFADDGKLHIVTTVFPEYDWIGEIVGDTDNADVILLTGDGVDMHNYQPSVDDIINILSCDLFVCIGGESDKWVRDITDTAENESRRTMILTDLLGDRAKSEEHIEGMQSEEEEEGKDGDEEAETDEHIWLSLENAKIICGALTDELCGLDPQNSAEYISNRDKYIKKLSELDELYRAAIGNAEKDTLVFADRFPFRYLADDYGITYYAAFPGCSAETEASFETVAFLASKVDELGLNAVMTIDGSDQKIARTVIESTNSKNQKILTLDSMQSMTSDKINSGMTYLSIMEDNLDIIKEALQ